MVEDILESRRRLVNDALASSFADIVPPTLRDAVAWYPEAGGKRLRPVMAMLACEASGGSAEAAMPIALAVELVHNFSLVHDDIMDHDATRRGRPTVHTKWDEPTAILAGDVLFARAFEVLARIPDADAHREAAQLLSKTVLRLCEGQALDMAFERRDDVTVEEYLQMIRGKTALLFEAATLGGALCAQHVHKRDAPRGVAPASPAAGGRDALEALSKYGDAFGMAFQIADDILDVTGDAKTLGKPWGSDVRAGKRTMLVLDARAHATPAQHAVLDAVMGHKDAQDGDVARVVQVFRDTGALSRAERERDRHARLASDALARLPPSDARDALAKLNAWAATRAF